MAHSILSLEVILIQHVVVRNMAVVAGGIVAMCAVAPGGVLRSHNMAVDTGGWVIAKIALCLG